MEFIVTINRWTAPADRFPPAPLIVSFHYHQDALDFVFEQVAGGTVRSAQIMDELGRYRYRYFDPATGPTPILGLCAS